MLDGDFEATGGDDPLQVIPSAWVQAAVDRWEPKSPKGKMTAMGCDPSRGGRDETIIACRHGDWVDELHKYPGGDVPDGPATAALVIQNHRNNCPVLIDALGWGASGYDFLKEKVQTIAVIWSEGAKGHDRSGKLEFFNSKARDWWKMREALDPAYDSAIALPNDSRLIADLCSPLWELVGGNKIKIEDKKSLIKRIGRSPDAGDAVVMVFRHVTRNDQKVKKINFQSEWNRNSRGIMRS